MRTVAETFENRLPLRDDIVRSVEPVAFEPFVATPITPVIGAQLTGVDLGKDLSQRVVSDLREALLQFQVLFFRDQHMSMEQHKNFGRHFGDLHVHPSIPGPEGNPEILMLHSDKDRPNAASVWHSDVSCD